MRYQNNNLTITNLRLNNGEEIQDVTHDIEDTLENSAWIELHFQIRYTNQNSMLWITIFIQTIKLEANHVYKLIIKQFAEIYTKTRSERLEL